LIKLRFIGTGGIGGVRIKNKLSKEYRRFSTFLIDERIIFDPSEDVFEFEESFMLSGFTKSAKDVFITNSSLDHLSITAIERLASACGGIRVYANTTVGEELRGISGVEFTEIAPLSLVKVDKYSILPLRANHKTDTEGECALNFFSSSGRHTRFYGLDGAMISADAWQILKECKLDVCVLECALANNGYSGDCFNHNNLDMACKVKELLTAATVATDSTKFILSHIKSSKKRSIHEELSEEAEAFGFRVAYDGYYLGL
jgi:hypothetical protein